MSPSAAISGKATGSRTYLHITQWELFHPPFRSYYWKGGFRVLLWQNTLAQCLTCRWLKIGRNPGSPSSNSLPRTEVAKQHVS